MIREDCPYKPDLGAGMAGVAFPPLVGCQLHRYADGVLDHIGTYRDDNSIDWECVHE